MADIRDYSTTASSNTDIAPENMAPSAVNDAIRALQAQLAKLIKDEGGTLTLGGTGTAYTLSLTTAPAALTDGLYFAVTANTAATGGSTTLVVTPSGGSAFASKKIKVFTRGSEQDPWADAMITGGHYLIQYDSAADSGTGAYILLNPSYPTATPTFTESYTSSQQTITTAGAFTLAHGLSAAPKLVYATLVCTTAEGGFSINDEVVVSVNGYDGTRVRGVSVTPTSTTLVARYSDAAAVFLIPHKTTGAFFSLTNSSWRLVLRAFA